MTLKTFAKILRDFAVDDSTAVGRWGGEEFVVVCYEKNAAEIKKIAEELRKKVEEYDFPEIKHITCSIGVTELKGDDTFNEAFNRLDKALYASKDNGRNMVTIL